MRVRFVWRNAWGRDAFYADWPWRKYRLGYLGCFGLGPLCIDLWKKWPPNG